MNKPLTHLVFDTETLGLHEGAVVTTLACVPFSFETKETFEQLKLKGFFVKFLVSEQIQTYKRKTDKSTLDWWSGQSEAAKANSIKPSSSDVGLEPGLTQLSRFIAQTEYEPKKSFVWSRGNYFDFPKIESLYRNVNMEVPFNGWKIRDTRTYFDILNGTDNGMYNIPKPKGFVAHHALDDAALEAYSMIHLYQAVMDERNS